MRLQRLPAAALAALFALGMAAAPALAKSHKHAPPRPAHGPAATAAALRDKALADPTAFSIVESLTTEVGERLAGTPAAERAKDWGLAKLTALGFQNVHAEPFTFPAWIRGAESAEVTAPYPQKLQILGLGRSPATPPGGIEAEIVLFHHYADLLAAKPGSLTGKIAVVTEPMPRNKEGSGYFITHKYRTDGPVEAARRGAVAYLLRSLSTANNRSPHAGAMHADEPLIPAAALGVADAELIDRMAASGKPVRIRLSLSPTAISKAHAWNVVGEITGSERPDEAVVIGGHLDSWDPGQGAIDDGAGVAITVAAARLIGTLPRHPRRTIRVVLFGAEELDYSTAAYAAAHKTEAPRIVVLAEADFGADPALSLQLPKGSRGAPALRPLASLLAPLKISIDAQPAQFAGDDFEDLQGLGVPVFGYRQDGSRYFDIHHSADDTLDKVSPEGLRQNVAAWASLLYLIADSDIDFRALAAAPAAKRP